MIGFGVFATRGERDPRPGARVEGGILDLRDAATKGLVSDAFDAESLDRFLSLGRDAWRDARDRIAAAVERGDGAVVAEADAVMHLPCTIGDYVDFYSSLSHATNLGRMFRPDTDPLLPNWRHLPVGYHGRSGTVVVSGTPIERPWGQRMPPAAEAPAFGPSVRLDFELELGFVTGGPANPLGSPVPVERAEERIFGVVLVNDWSARDIQAWEYQPLGPFLGKSFATSISPWIVPLDALEPYKRPLPPQDPAPLDYLRSDGDWLLDIELEIAIAPSGGDAHVVARTNAQNLYWSMRQQLAHATCNGAVANPGDLFASGTISGDTPGSYGSLIELSWNGTRPVAVGDQTRSFLEDGDTVTFTGRCGGEDLATVAGTIVSSRRR